MIELPDEPSGKMRTTRHVIEKPSADYRSTKERRKVDVKGREKPAALYDAYAKRGEQYHIK